MKQLTLDEAIAVRLGPTSGAGQNCPICGGAGTRTQEPGDGVGSLLNATCNACGWHFTDPPRPKTDQHPLCGERHASGVRCENPATSDGRCDIALPHLARRPDDDRLVAWVADVSQWFPELDNPWRGHPWTTWSPDQFGPEVEP